ncbi:Six-hairpin glycosidase-like protein [Suillus spraguei]|nr:Six-hairpin glycosidase-like protein [Suillus spraguei]
MVSSLKAALIAGLVHTILAATTTTSTAPGATLPTLTTSTAVASPSASLGATLPSQAPLPPTQGWCIGQIFCAGSLLQTVNIAQIYSDPKTFVDKPTSKSSQQVLADFNNFNVSTVTEGQIVNFVDNDFLGEGLELEAAALTNYNPTPAFLNNVTDPLLKAFAQTVHSYWTQLARDTNQSALCDEYPGGTCESSLIPLNHTFIIPGGRFREQYYWDSYWIIQGLIQSELYDTINATLQNFMDEIEDFGFIPNGGRIYYLNRSQPPLFIHMVYDYVNVTGDTSILQRALPLAESATLLLDLNHISLVGCHTESDPPTYLSTCPYLDYLTVHDPTLSTPLTDNQTAELYSELASGAETGWDYSSRFEAIPQLGNPGLRSLNVKNNIPVCLNSILYKANLLLAELYGTSNATASSARLQVAAGIRAGILDLLWDPVKLAFYDFNLTSNARNDIFTAATFYPVWNGIIPDEVLASQSNAFGYFAASIWRDAPNCWPPLQYIIMQALRAIPSNLTTNGLPTPSSNQSTYDLVPAGQLGFTEAQLPGQPFLVAQANPNATATGPAADINKLSGTVINGGNATAGEGWRDTLQREMANRYYASVLCSWHATGGSIPGLLPQLPASQLNVSNSIGNTGNMFEKFSNLNVDVSGSGGEYTVQAGFGWTNGVLLWVASTYGEQLVAPQCPPVGTAAITTGSTGAAVSLQASSGAVITVVAIVFIAFGIFL